MYVKAAPRLVNGEPLVVRDPDLKDHLPAEGRDVPETDYWLRRLRDGDVVLADPVVEVIAATLAIPATQMASDLAGADYSRKNSD